LKKDCPTAKDFLLKTPFLLPKTNPALLEKALELAGIPEQTLEQELITFSNGELRRLMLARNYMEEPDIWILDDPFGGMDPEYREFLAERIELFRKTGIKIEINSTRNDGADCRNAPLLMRLQFDGEIIFSLKNLCVSFGSKKVIENLNWTVHKGEHWAIMGANGSGKSTLLGVVSGDHPQCYNNELELLDKKKIGFFSPEMALHAPSRMSAFEILLESFPQPVLAEEKKFAIGLLSDLGLGAELNKPLENLSEEHKRLALIARAISKNPKLLILDEPTQDMSSQCRERLFAILEQISSKTTLIFATHYPGEWPKCVNNTLFLPK